MFDQVLLFVSLPCCFLFLCHQQNPAKQKNTIPIFNSEPNFLHQKIIIIKKKFTVFCSEVRDILDVIPMTVDESK